MNMDLDIQRVGLEGQGVGYDEAGNIYFVVGAVPGDRVRVSFPDTHKKYRDAELVEVVTPSPDRRESPCDYFRHCGGCDWLHWDYEAQLKAKDATLTHVLERGGWVVEDRQPIMRAENVLGYRNRIQLRAEGKKLGFLRRRSHEIVDIETCQVAHPSLNARLGELRREVAAGVEKTKYELSVGEGGEVESRLNSANAVGGFVQVNTEQNLALRSLVAKLLKGAFARNVVEAYCGNGNLTYSYLAFVDKVVAVDSSRSAIEAARAAKPAGFEDKAAFIENVVDAGMMKMLPKEYRDIVDTVVLDPPRTGSERNLEKWMLPNVKHVLYVSCSPTTFSQDVAALKGAFALEFLQAVDMFPQTRHIEFVALFRRV